MYHLQLNELNIAPLNNVLVLSLYFKFIGNLVKLPLNFFQIQSLNLNQLLQLRS